MSEAERVAAIKARIGRGAQVPGLMAAWEAKQREDYTERPVVVGDVWEGVLEFRTVRVKCWTDLLVWYADEGSRWHECLPLAEFRERFTRRGK